MASKFNLGVNLGQMLSGALDKTNSQKGYQDAMKGFQIESDIDLNRAKVGETESSTALKKRKFELQTDDALRRVARLNQGFSDGMEVPQDKMSDNNKQMANLLFAVGADNKNLDLQKMTQGIQRNNITADLTPQNAFEKALQVSVLEPNVNPLEIRKATLTDSIANSGAPNANENALLLSQGKGMFNNMGSDGTYNQVTGASTINPQAQKESSQKNAYSVPVQTAKGIFAFDTRAQKMVQMTDANGNPVIGSNSDTNLQKDISASKEEGKLIGKDKGNVISKQDALYSVKKAKELLEKGIYTGGFADIQSGIAKYTPLGDDEKLANTQTFVSEIGNTVVPRLQEFGGNDSNEEMRYLKSIMGGDITVEPETLKNVLDSVEFKIQRGIDRATQGLNPDGLPKNAKMPDAKPTNSPPVAGAKQAPDGFWYVPKQGGGYRKVIAQ